VKEFDNQDQYYSEKPLLFYLVAGEASGDILGSGLMEAIKSHFPNAIFKGIGGPLMTASGLNSYYPMERLSVMGVFPILARFFELIKLRKRLTQSVIDEKTDCFIGIDAPVFNTQLEYNLKQKGINTVHYVSPSVWAWRENRIYKIVKSVSLMICLFPFELEIYRRHRLPAVCVGHPLAEEITMNTDSLTAKDELGLDKEKTLIAILPGSRGSEMKFLLQPFINAAIKLSEKYPNLQFAIPCANKKRYVQLERYLDENKINLEVKLFDGQSRKLMQASDFVLLASGTATLEAMLLKKPMLVAYKVSAFSYWIYTKFLKINNFSLPNLLAKKQLVVELIQDDCHEDNIVSEMSRLIDGGRNEELVRQFNQLHKELRLGGSRKAAEAIANLLTEQNNESI